MPAARASEVSFTPGRCPAAIVTVGGSAMSALEQAMLGAEDPGDGGRSTPSTDGGTDGGGGGSSAGRGHAARPAVHEVAAVFLDDGRHSRSAGHRSDAASLRAYRRLYGHPYAALYAAWRRRSPVCPPPPHATDALRRYAVVIAAHLSLALLERSAVGQQVRACVRHPMMTVCVRACVRACLRACVRACVRARVRGAPRWVCASRIMRVCASREHWARVGRALPKRTAR